MENFVPTRAAQVKKNAKILHEVTTYEAHKKVKRSTKENENSTFKKNVEKSDDDEDVNMDDEPVDDKRKQELEMKKYRYDIIKFGMTGLKKTEARQAKIALAISLGAKPPKNKKRNYKKVIEQKKREKVQEKKKEKFSSGFSASKLSKNNKNIFNQEKKKGSGILDVYGKVTKDKKKSQKNILQKRRGRK